MLAVKRARASGRARALLVIPNTGPAQIQVASEPEPDPGPPVRLTRGLAQVEHPHRPLAFQDGQMVEAILGNQVTAASIEVAADTAIGSAVIHSRTRASFGWTRPAKALDDRARV